MSSSTQEIRFQVGEHGTVSGLVQAPPDALACYVFAHGAGAGMRHVFMAAVADGLAARGIATLRYQFPSMELGKKRPDPPAVAHAAVRAAVDQATQHFGPLPLYAGGKSFGGRMSSQAQALQPLPGVAGLVFVGFPLHPAGTPATGRADHLADVRVPMLFVQGTRDELAEIGHIRSVVSTLGPSATLMEIAEADHAFHVLRRSGRNDEEVLQQLLDGMAAWMHRQTSHP
ncbi:alpha/beta hydrolase family protein [Variovorax sp. JS1663]|uniref:alpha/beta hydrolase family protein n=1 Tax=Variovorax sp. JS1663 TaxID=1851577 RepID=UPI000B341FD5|nr:alpha/beta family hydrolase [Variovorax sp. JS1663]OUM03991.1 alpha/beta hydrolase [Variovorax sp. JS1663]